MGVTRLLPLLFVLAAFLPGLAPAATPHARIWLADKSPIMVKGTNFKPHERVVVTLTVGTRLVRTVTATRAGGFVAHWTSALSAVKSGCLFIRIQAVGNRGSVASFKIAGIECANGPTDPGE